MTRFGCLILVLLINAWIGGRSVEYLLHFFLGKTIPFALAALIGLIGGEVTVPAAIVVWLLQLAGVMHAVVAH